MAQDTHANYTKIGLAVVLGTLATIGALVHLAGIGDKSNEILVETYYDDPVDGLSIGSPVNFRGVKVGEVREIGFVRAQYARATAPEDAQRIWILIALDGRRVANGDHDDFFQTLDEYIAHGLRATLSSSGITGLSRIELGMPKVPVPVATLLWQPKYPLIPPAPSLMSSLSDAVRTAVDRFNRMDFVAVWSNVASVAESSARIADGANRLVESQRGGIESIVRNVDDASQSVRELTERLKDNPSIILRPSDPAPLPETSKSFFAP